MVAVSRFFIIALSDYCEHRGVEPAEVLGGRAERLDAGVTLQDYCQQLETAAHFFGDSLLGMHVGASVAIEQVGLLGFAARAASNLAEAIQLGMRFYPLIDNELRPQLSTAGQLLRIAWEPRGNETEHYSHLKMAAMTNFGRALTGNPQATPQVVSFRSSPPSRKAELEQHFGCPAAFHQPQDALDVHFEHLSSPLTQSDGLLFSTLARELELALVQHQPPRSTQEEAIATIVERLASDGIPTIDEVARAFGSSTRDLIRTLAAEGLLFRKIRDARLGQIAQRLLLSTQSVAEVALQVGYSDQSSFTRSFRRWTGTSPQQWRRQHRSEGRGQP